MTHEQFKRELKYRAALSISDALLAEGFITSKEYVKIDTILNKKHRPILGSLRSKLS